MAKLNNNWILLYCRISIQSGLSTFPSLALDLGGGGIVIIYHLFYPGQVLQGRSQGSRVEEMIDGGFAIRW